MKPLKPKDIDSYISQFPKETQVKLQQLRELIIQVEPHVEETISYGMPTFNLNSTYLIYFACYKHHIGMYPVPVGMPEFEKDFSNYKTSGKGAIQFPLDKPLPTTLIKRIIAFKVKQHRANR